MCQTKYRLWFGTKRKRKRKELKSERPFCWSGNILYRKSNGGGYKKSHARDEQQVWILSNISPRSLQANPLSPFPILIEKRDMGPIWWIMIYRYCREITNAFQIFVCDLIMKECFIEIVLIHPVCQTFAQQLRARNQITLILPKTYLLNLEHWGNRKVTG